MIHNNRGMALFMALVLLIVMVSLASIFVVNLISGLSFFHKQFESQIAFNLAEAGIEKAIWHFSQPGSRYEGERDTRLGEGTFTVNVVDSRPDTRRVIVISHGFYPAGNGAHAECAILAVLGLHKNVRVILWKQIPQCEINKIMEIRHRNKS